MPGQVIHERKFAGGKTFTIVVYDLLAEPVDGIVNAANSGLSHGGGIAEQISSAAGPDFDEECRALVARLGHIPVGHAVVTSAGNLPFKGIIHAVGPRMGAGDEQGKIESALLAAFRRAELSGWRSISFPGISSGLFLVPERICASAYLCAVEKFFEESPTTCLATIRLCLLQGRLLDEIRRQLP